MRFPVGRRQEQIWKICGRIGELVYSGRIQAPQYNDGGIKSPDELEKVPKENVPNEMSQYKQRYRIVMVSKFVW